LLFATCPLAPALTSARTDKRDGFSGALATAYHSAGRGAD
jgi:hypothetical protein